MQLIASLTSPYARKIRVILAEKGLSHVFVNDPPWEAGTHIANFNPLGKVPALIADNGEVFFDSPVIAEYIETLGAAPFLLPADRLEAVRVKQLEALADGVLDAAVLVLLEGRRPAAQQSDSWKARQWSKVELGLAAFNRLTDGRAWLYGETMTLADIAAAIMVGWLGFRFPQFDLASKYPALAAWAAPLLARPSFVHSEPPPA